MRHNSGPFERDGPVIDIRLLADQRQAVRDGEQLVAGLDAVGSEALFEQPAHGGHEGRAAREEDLVDLAGAHRGVAQRLVERAVDAREIVGDPGLEIGALDLRPDLEVAGGEWNSVSSAWDSRSLASETAL